MAVKPLAAFATTITGTILTVLGVGMVYRPAAVILAGGVLAAVGLVAVDVGDKG